MPENAFPGSVIVESIDLTSFYYDIDFKPDDDHKIIYQLNTLHRIFLESKRVEVRIDITYLAEGHDKPVVSGTCVTSFMIEEISKVVVESTGRVKWRLAGEQLQILAHESVAHTRALLALHTAATPLGNTHLTIFDHLKLQLEPVQDDEPVE
ncbi:hypothetical protein [Hymenobacter profundi]|uniref:Uncharacterized protein n=1 Tax=Hymenobacter profundi TaxID=1982110 RepID=A0ABS6WZK8_9BACT|nr:hypothetical protein [Hymenobacter profundi]MBW3128869.1 hypothetical protein [Hymenobacter profundi]